MASPFTRTTLYRGPAMVQYNGHTFFTRDDIVARLAPEWGAVNTSMYGEVDSVLADRVYQVPLTLWGAWENLADLFPAAVMAGTVGASIFGASDKALTIWGRNGDKVVYANAAVTKLANLHLGVGADLFSSAVEFTCLRANTANPEDANAYFTLSNSPLTEDAFAKTNFSRQRWTAAWGSVAGFASFVGEKGIDISWEAQMEPVRVEGWGTSDFTLAGFKAQARCIPIGPTLAQLEAASQSQDTALGSLLSGAVADLTLSAAKSGTIVLKNAALREHGYAFGQTPLRIGECVWETTRLFVDGVPGVVASVA